MIDPLSVAKWDAAARLETYGAIADAEGNVRQPVCNAFQREVSSIVRWCHEHGRPARLIILKPRRKGSSTISVAVGHARLHAQRATGLIAGGSHYQARKLFGMLKVYAEHDKAVPGACKIMDMEARYANGSTMDRLSLATSAAGRSGGYQFLVVTEAAYLAQEGVANAADVLNGLLKTVQFVRDTIIILESTANGAQGDFFDRWQQGISFDEFKAGRNGYVRVFYPWFAFDDSRIENLASEGITGPESMTAMEADLAGKWGLSLEQVAWMRWALREECRGDWDKFCEDYPFDADSAFLRSGRGKFSVEGLEWQDRRAEVCERRFGVIERGKWRDTGENEAMAVLWEKPREGMRYVVAADVMTGASQTGGSDPDSHALFVLRDGYKENGAWREAAVVARNMCWADGTRFGCWWDVDVLEEQIYRLSQFYGGAVIAVEMNMDRGVVELLKLREDANIYRRKIFNRRENIETEALGWMTTPQTRGKLVEDLARAVRESGRGLMGEGLEVRCPWAIRQMRNFVVTPSGRCEAASGHHDDDVLGLGIGLQVLGEATQYSIREVDEFIPPDLRGRERQAETMAQWR